MTVNDPWAHIPAVSSKDELLAIVPLSKRRIEERVKENKLVAHYEGSKPLFYKEDVVAYLESLPTERPGA
jgi:hypothetical protein